MIKAIVLTDNFGNGGAERVASLIINGLVNTKSVDVHVCVFENINNYKINQNKVSFHLLTNVSGSHIRRIINRISNFVKVIKKVKPTVIYSFGPIMATYVYIAVKISRVNGIKIIASERNDPRKEPVSNIKKNIRDFCYNRADVLVCQTPMAVELLKSRGINVNYVVIPNPITPDLPQWKGLNSKEIITASRLTEQKNLPMLIRAFSLVHKKFPDFKLSIYGQGELRGSLLQLISSLHLQDVIQLKDFSKEIHKIMSHSYMYVSSSDYEGISNSMLEALGIGLPTICTDCPVGGASMVIKDGINGLLVNVGDDEGLAKAIEKLLSNRILAMQFSKSSRYINDRYTLSKITEQWIKLIKN